MPHNYHRIMATIRRAEKRIQEAYKNDVNAVEIEAITKEATKEVEAETEENEDESTENSISRMTQQGKMLLNIQVHAC